MKELYFEQGPIRPPSEAYSLLLRLTRNCPWNRCEFCHTYKGKKFIPRTVEEIKKEIDTIGEIVSELKQLSWKHGFGGEITASLVNQIIENAFHYPQSFYGVSLWLYNDAKTVFLQDADSLILKTSQVIEILNYLKKSFPSIERITTYARAKTISKKSVEDLHELNQAGISRIHIGLETGYDPLLEFVKKGVTAQEQIEAGRKVKESGISLSEYVILGLGGKKWWKEHAIETARVLNQINPDFIRVRTLKVLESMPLYEKINNREFELLSDDEIIIEERLLIENLEGVTSNFVSDHILNLLEEVHGKFPEEKEKMIARIDKYLSLPEEERMNFRIGRRAGVFKSMEELSNPILRDQVERVKRRIELERPGEMETVISEMMESFI